MVEKVIYTRKENVVNYKCKKGHQILIFYPEGSTYLEDLKCTVKGCRCKAYHNPLIELEINGTKII